MKVTGFVLLALAAVLTVLTFSDLQGYSSGRSLGENLSVALAFRRSTFEMLPCPVPALGSSFTSPDLSVPGNCPTYPGQRRSSTYAVGTVSFEGVRLGIALAVYLAIALVGTGLLIFGKSKS